MSDFLDWAGANSDTGGRSSEETGIFQTKINFFQDLEMHIEDIRTQCPYLYECTYRESILM